MLIAISQSDEQSKSIFGLQITLERITGSLFQHTRLTFTTRYNHCPLQILVEDPLRMKAIDNQTRITFHSVSYQLEQ